MSNSQRNKETFRICIGTGLIALDVVINDSSNSFKLWAGGSCGNVLTILAYLGWESYPIARLANDTAAKELMTDMEKWGVNTQFMSQTEDGSTPIIIEKIKNRKGIPQHHYEWVCPRCGSWLPKYKPYLLKDVEPLSQKIPKTNVFYFDRATPSSIKLARISKASGAIIMFEPSSIKDEKLFRECLKISDIVKYSIDRLKGLDDFSEGIEIPLEIVTLGSEGLKYRTIKRRNRKNKWTLISSYTVKDFKDSAGSGDWCTAGILHSIGHGGKKGFDETNIEDLENALYYGQSLAALNCSYEGARGSMYNISKEVFEVLVNEIYKKKNSPELLNDVSPSETEEIFQCICPSCVNNEIDKRHIQ
jgi:fructokinase